MSQEQKQQSNHSTTVRAEEVLDRLGHHLGLLAGRASQRVQGAATALRERAERQEWQAQPKTEAEQPSQPATASAEEKGKSATEEAEELVDRMGQRLSLVASLASRQLQKAVALLREEAEDMWAEAQDIRQENRRKPQ